MKNICYLLLSFCLLFAACSKRIMPSVTTDTKDSVSVKETVQERDTTIKIKGESVSEAADITPFIEQHKDEKNNVVVKVNMPEITNKSGRSNVSVNIKDNVLTATATCDSAEYQIKLKDRIIEKYRGIIKSKYEQKPVPYVPAITKKLAAFGLVCCGLLIFFVGYKVYNFKSKLLK